MPGYNCLYEEGKENAENINVTFHDSNYKSHHNDTEPQFDTLMPTNKRGY